MQAQTAVVQTVADTLYNNIKYLFNADDWKCLKTPDQLRYTNSLVPLDEYVIDTDINKINVSIPLNSISYKTTFVNFNDAINYLKLHRDYYDSSF
jgi:hypothetical protein